jgi:hypothetical protein
MYSHTLPSQHNQSITQSVAIWICLETAASGRSKPPSVPRPQPSKARFDETLNRSPPLPSNACCAALCCTVLRSGWLDGQLPQPGPSPLRLTMHRIPAVIDCGPRGVPTPLLRVNPVRSPLGAVSACRPPDAPGPGAETLLGCASGLEATRAVSGSAAAQARRPACCWPSRSCAARCEGGAGAAACPLCRRWFCGPRPRRLRLPGCGLGAVGCPSPCQRSLAEGASG